MSVALRLWSEYGVRLVRYGGVTVVTTVVGLIVLFGGLSLWDLRPAWANVLSVAASTPFAYVLNRRFVWLQDGEHSVSSEIAPFWAMSFLGLAVSTAVFALAGLVTASIPLLLFVQFGTFGALWVVKFSFLEKFLWPQDAD